MRANAVEDLDQSIVDGVSEKIQQWGRWRIVKRAEDADLLLALSTSKVDAGFDEKIVLTAIDRVSNATLVTVSSYRGHLFAKAPSLSVAHLRSQIEKHEKLNRR